MGTLEKLLYCLCLNRVRYCDFPRASFRISSLPKQDPGRKSEIPLSAVRLLMSFEHFFPREDPGGKLRMCPPYPQRDRKRRLNGAVCRNHRIEWLVRCRCLDGHVKEPYEMSMALGARP